VIGRRKVSGAPIGRRDEFDPLDLEAADGAGRTLVPPDAHVRLAAPETNGGIEILRRGYSYTDGIDPRTGQLDAGLFFISFQRDPHAQFVPLQRKLGTQDALVEYIKHVGSGLFAVPGGVRPGRHIGEGLFAGLRV
jgi:deferrochelatase/peroxidase EfeB